MKWEIYINYTPNIIKIENFLEDFIKFEMKLLLFCLCTFTRSTDCSVPYHKLLMKVMLLYNLRELIGSWSLSSVKTEQFWIAQNTEYDFRKFRQTKKDPQKWITFERMCVKINNVSHSNSALNQSKIHCFLYS